MNFPNFHKIVNYLLLSFTMEGVSQTVSISMDEILKNGYNLNISRYVSTSIDEVQIDLKEVNTKLTIINKTINSSTDKHNVFLKELGLEPI